MQMATNGRNRLRVSEHTLNVTRVYEYFSY